MTRRVLVRMLMDLERRRPDPAEPAPSVSDTDSSGGRARRAIARSRITMQPETAKKVASNEMNKGDVLGTARFAGVQAAKEADACLPLCDSVLVNDVTVGFSVGVDFIEVEASTRSASDSGVDMHALTAATVVALTVCDMCKSVDRTMAIGPVSLVNQDNGRARPGPSGK